MPFPLADDGATVELHLVRSNRIANNCQTQQPAILVVSGPDSYISPDWYGIEEQVPTWNYVAVHVHGTLERRPQDELRAVIEGLSEQFEQRLAPKPVWKTDKVPAEALDRMMRMIVPFRFAINSTEATWKLAQNKPDSARQSAAEMVRKHGIGQESDALAELMTRLAKS